MKNYEQITRVDFRKMMNGQQVISVGCYWVNERNKQDIINLVEGLPTIENYKEYLTNNLKFAKTGLVKSDHIIFIKKDGTKSYLYHEKDEKFFRNNNTYVIEQYNDRQELNTILVYEVI